MVGNGRIGKIGIRQGACSGSCAFGYIFNVGHDQVAGEGLFTGSVGVPVKSYFSGGVISGNIASDVHGRDTGLRALSGIDVGVVCGNNVKGNRIYLVVFQGDFYIAGCSDRNIDFFRFTGAPATCEHGRAQKGGEEQRCHDAKTSIHIDGGY